MAHKEIAAFEDLATQIFDFAESFPRLADLGVEPLRGAPGERGALLLQGPLKMLQTVVMVTVNGKAQGVADRFKALLSRSKWVAADAVDGALAGSFTPQPTRPWMSGAEGLKERLREHDPATQFVLLLVAEGLNGGCCQHGTVSGIAAVEDRGPCAFVLDHGRSRTGKRPGFNYSGSLRPARVTPARPVPDAIAKPDYFSDGNPAAEAAHPARNTPPVLNEAEAAKMRHANRIGREILDAAARVVRVGVTTDEIDRVVHDATIAAGAYPAPLHYHDFPKSVCTSVNEVVCHGIPDLRPLEDGDIVNVDVSAIVDGYHTDLNETFCVGTVAAPVRALVKASHDSLWKVRTRRRPRRPRRPRRARRPRRPRRTTRALRRSTSASPACCTATSAA